MLQDTAGKARRLIDGLHRQLQSVQVRLKPNWLVIKEASIVRTRICKLTAISLGYTLL